MTVHRCDERCTCPVHDIPLYYSPARDDHACQDRDCEYAHGMNALLPEWGPPGSCFAAAGRARTPRTGGPGTPGETRPA